MVEQGLGSSLISPLIQKEMVMLVVSNLIRQWVHSSVEGVEGSKVTSALAGPTFLMVSALVATSSILPCTGSELDVLSQSVGVVTVRMFLFCVVLVVSLLYAYSSRIMALESFWFCSNPKNGSWKSFTNSVSILERDAHQLYLSIVSVLVLSDRHSSSVTQAKLFLSSTNPDLHLMHCVGS